MTKALWTKAGARLPVAACAAIGLLMTTTWRAEGTDVASGAVVVGPNVPVSASGNDKPHHEVQIGADPADPRRLIACGMVDHAGAEPSVRAWLSLDGGRSWQQTTAISAGDSWVGDPTCAWGLGGVALLSALHHRLPPREPRLRMMTVRFADSQGANWRESSIRFPWGSGDHDRAAIDRQYLVADHVSSRFKSRVYLHAQARALGLNGDSMPYAFTLWRSLDGGRTFEMPVQRLLGSRDSYLYVGNGVVLPSGTFGAVVQEPAARQGAQGAEAADESGTVKFITSTDGGETLNVARVIATGQVALHGERHAFPVAAVVPRGPLVGRICVAWAERRPGRNSRIVLSSSDDEGATWSRPRSVSDERRLGPDAWTGDAFMPAIAINDAGIVAVTWYDRRDGVRGRLDYGVRMAVSTDGGTSFGKSVKVSTAIRTVGADEHWVPIADAMNRRTVLSPNPSEVSFRVIRDLWASAGHTAGLAAAADGSFHPLWVDNRTGVDQVWSARVKVAGQADERGPGVPSHQIDVTGRSVLKVRNLRFDAGERRLLAEVALVNKSDEAIVLPMTLRVTALESELGDPILENATDGGPGVGAIYTFAAARPGDRLDPGMSTAPLSVEVRFVTLEASPPSAERIASPEWLTLSAKVYANGVTPWPPSHTAPSY